MARPAPILPDNLDDLRAVEAAALAQNADDAANIFGQKLEIAKLKRQIYRPRSELSARLSEQMELDREDRPSANRQRRSMSRAWLGRPVLPRYAAIRGVRPAPAAEPASSVIDGWVR